MSDTIVDVLKGSTYDVSVGKPDIRVRAPRYMTAELGLILSDRDIDCEPIEGSAEYLYRIRPRQMLELVDFMQKRGVTILDEEQLEQVHQMLAPYYLHMVFNAVSDPAATRESFDNGRALRITTTKPIGEELMHLFGNPFPAKEEEGKWSYTFRDEQLLQLHTALKNHHKFALLTDEQLAQLNANIVKSGGHDGVITGGR